MEIITKSASETKELGKKLASDIKDRDARVFALVGDLGAGKTTFVQGFAEGLGLKNKIISPTFILLRHYEIPVHRSIGYPLENLYHVDLYRLERHVEGEVVSLGLTDVWEEPGNLVLIEWADKAIGIMPKNTTWIKFEEIDENTRKITIE